MGVDMNATVPTWTIPVFILLMIPYFVWMPFSYVKRATAMSRSLQRYYWNTVERLCCPLALAWAIWPVYVLIVPTHQAPQVTRASLMMGGTVLLIWLFGYVLQRRLDRDDDDDAFKRLGRRVLRGWHAWRERRHVAVPRPLGT